MKKIWVTLMMLLAVNVLAVDNFVAGYDFSSSTGLLSYTTLDSLVAQGKISAFATDATNNFYIANPTYFFCNTNTGAGYTNYYLDIKASSLTSDLLSGGGYPTTAGDNTWSGTNTFTGDFLVISNDMAVSFMGYPKVTLTTNMVTVSSGGGTPFTVSSFTNIFDADLKTRATADAPTAGVLHKYIIDLGESYVGYVATSHGSTNSTGGSVLSTYNLHAHEGLYNGYLTKNNGSVILQGGNGSYNNSMWINASQTGGVTNMMTAPFQGRYVTFSITSDSGVPDYFMSDLSVWAQASTNAWRNMGESQ